MADSNLDFYSQRAREEQALAEAETRPELVAAHRLLMEIYADRVDELTRSVEPASAFGWQQPRA